MAASLLFSRLSISQSLRPGPCQLTLGKFGHALRFGSFTIADRGR